MTPAEREAVARKMLNQPLIGQFKVMIGDLENHMDRVVDMAEVLLEKKAMDRKELIAEIRSTFDRMNQFQEEGGIKP